MPPVKATSDRDCSRALSRRLLAAAYVLLVALAVTAASASAAKPRPQGLWEKYPLDPHRQRAATPASETRGPLARSTRVSETPPAADRADSHLLKVGSLALVAVLAAGTAVLRVSRRQALAGGVEAADDAIAPASTVGSQADPTRPVPVPSIGAEDEDPVETSPGEGRAEPDTDRPEPVGAEGGRPRDATGAEADSADGRNKAARSSSATAASAQVTARGLDVEPARGAPPDAPRPQAVPEPDGPVGEPSSTTQPRCGPDRALSGLEEGQQAVEAESKAEPRPTAKPDRPSVEPRRSPGRAPSGLKRREQAVDAESNANPSSVGKTKRTRSQPRQEEQERPIAAAERAHAAMVPDSSPSEPRRVPEGAPGEAGVSEPPAPPTGTSRAEPRSAAPGSPPSSGSVASPRPARSPLQAARGETPGPARDVPTARKPLDGSASQKYDGPSAGRGAHEDPAPTAGAGDGNVERRHVSRSGVGRPDHSDESSLPALSPTSEEGNRSPAAPPSGSKGSQAPAGERGGLPEWCSIVCARSNGEAEFQVVVLEKGGQRRVVARSPSFRVRRSGPIRMRGESRTAFELLVTKVLASGWRRLKAPGRWHDTAFTRVRPDPRRPPVQRLLIGCRRDGQEIRFHADELDTYGNGTPVAESQPFPARSRGSLQPTEEAKAAHEALLARLCSEGWTATGAVSPEWYARVLQRPGG